jgi:hypothetical protein
MQKRGAKRFGEASHIEIEIIEDIIFRREMKGQTFTRIAEDLNAMGKWPRRAQKWMWLLVRNIYMANRTTTGAMKGISNVNP